LIDTIAVVERNELTESLSARRYGWLRLKLHETIDVLPGQFAMLKPQMRDEPLLRRAMAYYRGGRSEDGTSVEFIYQILGRGTQCLAQLRPGDEVSFLGSLGNTYDRVAAQGREAILVAGGVGSAALLMLAERLRRAEIPTKLFIGGASRGDLPGIDDFIALLGEANVTSATVDGTYGVRGFVTEPLVEYLRTEGERIIYACGPDPMLHRVAQIAEERDLWAQLSLESPMACGFGICVGCAVAVKADCPEGFIYQKVCTDGPIFWGNQLYWGA